MFMLFLQEIIALSMFLVDAIWRFLATTDVHTKQHQRSGYECVWSEVVGAEFISNIRILKSYRVFKCGFIGPILDDRLKEKMSGTLQGCPLYSLACVCLSAGCIAHLLT